jgi:hypothetical protein
MRFPDLQLKSAVRPRGATGEATTTGQTGEATTTGQAGEAAKASEAGVPAAETGPWPELPDDSEIWRAAPMPSTSDRLIRLDREQAGA